jgi:enoyl-CoA hydratase/carnithine racemase
MTPEELAAVGLRLDLDGPVATVTLDRPDVRNAQTPAMWLALGEIGRTLPDDVRVVVESVIGLLSLSDEEASARIEEFQRGFTWLRDPRFVSIAKVRGYAIGAGFQLALSCDLRVVADDAKFSMKESALGLVPDLTGTKPLVEHVGYARALEICATARVVTADEAVRIGLATASVPGDQLDAAVADLAATLVAPMPGVVPETKALLQGAADRDLDEQRRLERESQVRRFRAVAAALAG